MNVPIWLWAASVGVVLVLLAVDLLTSRGNGEISMRQAWIKSGIWVSLGIAFGFVILGFYNPEYAAEYWSGFLTEKALSIDNVFVWALIFTSFQVPRRFQYRVLFLGVVGAIILRAIFIAVGAQLIHTFAWVLYIFAAFLIYSGIRMLLSSGHEKSPTDSKFLKLFTKLVRTSDEFHEGKFLVKIDGKTYATRLLVVLALVEFTDVLFAVDSIPAVFAVTDEPYIVFTSNVFALLGLRSLYFVLADLVHRFIYLKYGLSAVLIWVGAKMALHDVVKIPTALSLSVIALTITVSIVASIRATRAKN